MLLYSFLICVIQCTMHIGVYTYTGVHMIIQNVITSTKCILLDHELRHDWYADLELGEYQVIFPKGYPTCLCCVMLLCFGLVTSVG